MVVAVAEGAEVAPWTGVGQPGGPMDNEQPSPHCKPTTLKEQWIAAIEEHLATVRWCLDRSHHGGRIKGYSAALLLFCIIDAMGNGLLPPIKDKKSGRVKSTRLDVLLQCPFDHKALKLDTAKVRNLTIWYRNKLTHTGAMAPNAILDHSDGDPFTFDANGSPCIRVTPLYQFVEAAWTQRDQTAFELSTTYAAPQPSSTTVSTASPYASGAIQNEANNNIDLLDRKLLYGTRQEDIE
jgi:hypothetical protein